MTLWDIAIVGAGIAGIATADALLQRDPTTRILLLDKLLPMSLTTSKSGENFRNYWPQPCMTAFAERSLDLMQELAEVSQNAFDLRTFGYEFVSESADPEHLLPRDSDRSRWGLRQVLDGETLRQRYPYLAPSIRQVLHIERAGAIDVYALGSWLLARARAAGLVVAQGTVVDLDHRAGEFELQVQPGDGCVPVDSETIRSTRLVLAAGPFVGDLAQLLGVELPIQSFLQRKIVLSDPDQIIPRTLPFTIFADPQVLGWSDEERELLNDDPELRWLLDPFPGGLHIKPESHDQIKLGWAYNRTAEEPRWNPADETLFPNIVLRGASRCIPALGCYADTIPTPVVQYSGYYTRTQENWPLIGPLEPEGLFTVAALSGYGTMCACAAGELCAAWLTEGPLPNYARHFHPARYDDPAIVAEIATLDSDGQL